MQLQALCTYKPGVTFRWRVTNNHPFDLAFIWQLVGTQVTGAGTVAAYSESVFETTATAGSNELILYWTDPLTHTLKTTTATNVGAPCNAPGPHPTPTSPLLIPVTGAEEAPLGGLGSALRILVFAGLGLALVLLGAGILLLL